VGAFYDRSIRSNQPNTRGHRLRLQYELSSEIPGSCLFSATLSQANAKSEDVRLEGPSSSASSAACFTAIFGKLHTLFSTPPIQ
jgi:hypothetical protein